MLVVHAHPDDEVFATAAATIAYARRGWRVRLRIFTGGEAASGWGTERYERIRPT